MHPDKPRSAREILLNLAGMLTRPTIYGVAVTLVLGLYFTARAGELTALPRMFKFVSLQFTPWFMLGYHVARQVLPDLDVRRPSNLLLPAVEGVAAVFVMATLLALHLELANPYWNFALNVLELVASIVLARLWVRRTFRH